MNDAEGDTVVVFDTAVLLDAVVWSQFFDLNSDEMSSRIIESGTRLPDCMADSALMPVGS